MTESNGHHRDPSKPPKGPRPGGTDGPGGPKRRPGPRPPAGPKPAGPKPGTARQSPIGVRRVEGETFYELVHPPCVEETELDYQEGIEIWEAGEPEEARDALRFALEGCPDNLWVHVALGDLAYKEFRDPRLAMGHYGYAFELAHRSLPADFAGKLPRGHAPNRPFHDAIVGLVSCLRAIGEDREADELRKLSEKLR